MKCLNLFPFSNIIITETMDVYEVYVEDDEILLPSPEDYHEEYFVRKLPMKATIDFNFCYGDGGSNNWCCDHLPWIEGKDNKLIWDY